MILRQEISKIEDSVTEGSKTEAFKDYQKRQTLRLYEMPAVTHVPVKEEDFVEEGVQVEFKVKSQVRPLILYRIVFISKLNYPDCLNSSEILAV